MTSDVHQSATASDHGSVYQAGRDLILRRQHLLSSIDVTAEAREGKRSFVEPPNYTAAVATLENPLKASPIVVLRGAVGTGRRSSALALLDRRRPERIEDLMTDWRRPRAIELPCEENGRYLLDLTFEPEDIPESFVRELDDFAETAWNNNARLIIVVTEEKWRLCHRVDSDVTVDLGIPDQIEVLDSHLRVHQIPRTIADLKSLPLINDVLKNLETGRWPPHRAAELATTIAATITLDETTAAQVHNEYFGWRSDLDQQLKSRLGAPSTVSQSVTAQQRALLIAAAVLDGADADAVLTSADYLLRGKITMPQNAELLTAPELSNRLEDIGATRAGDRIFLTRLRRGIDQAVLDRVWNERPQLRGPLLKWLGTITSDGQPAKDYVDQVSRVLGRLAVEHRSVEVLDIVLGWLQGRQQQRRLAIDLIDTLAASVDIGQAVRRRLYQLVSSPSTSPEVLTGIADVCAGQFGQLHPSMALVRLRFLIDSDNANTREVAQAAVRSLAQQNAEQRHLVVNQALDWFKPSTPKSRNPNTESAGRRALLTLFDPQAEGAVAKAILSDINRHDEFSQKIVDAFSKLMSEKATRARIFELADAMMGQADAQTLDQSAVLDLLTPAIQCNMKEESGTATLLVGTGGRTREELIFRLVQHAPRHAAVARSDN